MSPLFLMGKRLQPKRLKAQGHSRIFSLVLFVLLFYPQITRATAAAPVAEHYSGIMILPIDLVTEEGTKIKKGKYAVEISPAESRWTLSFQSESKSRVEVKGNIVTGDPFVLPATIPLLGTHYLRSSSEPLKTAQERQFSKTGLPQYAEEERSWRATIRVYRSSTETDGVFFIFQVRDDQGHTTRVDFKVRTEGTTASPPQVEGKN